MILHFIGLISTILNSKLFSKFSQNKIELE